MHPEAAPQPPPPDPLDRVRTLLRELAAFAEGKGLHASSAFLAEAARQLPHHPEG